jgi:hypothetical protein
MLEETTENQEIKAKTKLLWEDLHTGKWPYE